MLMCSLMALQQSAERQRNRFHGFREPESAIVLFEGIFVICIYVLCFGFILKDDDNLNIIDYLREMAILIFNIVQLFMLFPLRVIAVEPDITKNYFLDPKKQKYKRTFEWISFLNFTTFIYAFIFIANTFASKLQRTDNNSISILSYTFSFCMPYYSIWAISQYDKWVNLNKTNLPYQESEFSVNHNPRRVTSLDATFDDDEKKEEISYIQRRDRLHSETEMSIQSSPKNGDDRLSSMFRSKPKIIKRNKFEQRRRASEGGKPLDMNSNGYRATTPSIPENYDRTMSMFDKSKLKNDNNTKKDDESPYDISGLTGYDKI